MSRHRSKSNQAENCASLLLKGWPLYSQRHTFSQSTSQSCLQNALCISLGGKDFCIIPNTVSPVRNIHPKRSIPSHPMPSNHLTWNNLEEIFNWRRKHIHFLTPTNYIEFHFVLLSWDYSSLVSGVKWHLRQHLEITRVCFVTVIQLSASYSQEEWRNSWRWHLPVTVLYPFKELGNSRKAI